MARTKTISKESIIDGALEIIKNEGFEFLNARHLSEELKITPTAIFTNFGSMKNLISIVRDRAKKEFEEKLILPDEGDMIFREFGRQFMKYVLEDTNLFRFLFLTKECHNADCNLDFRNDVSQTLVPVRDYIVRKFNLSQNMANELLHCMMIFASGLAMASLNQDKVVDLESYQLMLFHAATAVVEHIKKNEFDLSPEDFNNLPGDGL